MLISRLKMQLIVEEMEKSIHKPINIMDREGVIIASTDETRIGTVHTGAAELIQQKLSQVVIDKDCSHSGSKNGINLPIVIHDELVGVVGITGPKREVEVFGPIIKKMCELLIYDSCQTEQLQQLETAKYTFIYQWIFDHSFLTGNENDFLTSAELLGINTSIPRSVVILQLKEPESSPRSHPSPYSKQIKRLLHSKFPQKHGNIHVQLSNRFILLTNDIERHSLTERLTDLKKIAEALLPMQIAIGIGTPSLVPQDIPSSYKEADKACQFSVKTKDGRIKWYQETDLSVFLQDIPDHKQISFVQKLFSGCDNAGITIWMNMLHYFFEFNGSITKTAGSLYIHKNTLQYRLSKLKDLTGYDPRILQEAMPLYTAMLIYENNELLQKLNI